MAIVDMNGDTIYMDDNIVTVYPPPYINMLVIGTVVDLNQESGLVRFSYINRMMDNRVDYFWGDSVDMFLI